MRSRARAIATKVLGTWQAVDPAAAAATPPWIARCVLAADQFVVAAPDRRRNAKRVDDRGLPLVRRLGTRHDDRRCPDSRSRPAAPTSRKEILRRFHTFVDGGMLPNYFPDGGQTPQYNTVDAALLVRRSAARYVEASRRSRALLRDSVPSLSKSSTPIATERATASTWMPTA